MLPTTIGRTCFSLYTRALATKQLLASCSKVHKPCVLRHMAMSIVEDVDKLIWEVERPPPLYKKIERIQC
jgi:hypothetical protein